MAIAWIVLAVNEGHKFRKGFLLHQRLFKFCLGLRQMNWSKSTAAVRDELGKALSTPSPACAWAVGGKGWHRQLSQRLVFGVLLIAPQFEQL
eukprot:5762993-Pleurochrysis_carterae.AAC.1